MSEQLDKKSILEMSMGAILERVDYEMGKVSDNILDLNTKPNAKRKITVTLELIPSADRKTITVQSTAKAALVPTDPVTTSLFITGAEQAGGGIHHELHSDRCLVDRGGETQLNGSFPIGIQGTSGLLEIHTQFRHCLFGALHIGRGCSQRAGEQSDQHCRSQKTGNQFVFAHNATSVYIWI